jgi:hypothetical protein
MSLSLRTVAAAAAVLAFAMGPAFAEQVKFSADLTGGAEVPPTDSNATGKVDATLDTDTKVFTWSITYDGLSGAPTGAHFHGPAAADATADPVAPIPDDKLATSPITGEATLDDAQIGDLQAGMWYFNVHTEKFPDGEIRGQVTKAAM